MYNEELFDKLEAEFGTDKLVVFSEIMAKRHELLYMEHLNDGLEDFTEEDFEQAWWANKYAELCKRKVDPVILAVANKLLQRSAFGIKKYNTTLDENNTDNFLIHLQEELLDGANYIQKLLQTLKQKGYSKLQDVPNHNDFGEGVEISNKID